MLVNQSGIALTLYDDALAANPGDPVLLKKKAEALIGSGQTGDAEQIYQQLLSQYPNDPAVLVRMGDFSYWNGDYPGAISYYDTALSIQPKNAQILLRDGDAGLMLAGGRVHATGSSGLTRFSDCVIGQNNALAVAQYYIDNAGGGPIVYVNPAFLGAPPQGIQNPVATTLSSIGKAIVTYSASMTFSAQ